MEHPGTLVSRMQEAAHHLPPLLFDPAFWDAIFAVFVLMILYFLVSSVRRLNKQISSVSKELSGIRFSLENVERVLRRTEPAPSKEDDMRKDLQDLLFRMEKDRPD